MCEKHLIGLRETFHSFHLASLDDRTSLPISSTLTASGYRSILDELTQNGQYVKESLVLLLIRPASIPLSFLALQPQNPSSPPSPVLSIAVPLCLSATPRGTAMRDQGSGKPDDPVSQLKMESKTNISLPQPPSKWNTKNLFSRLAVDAASAAAAASLLAPLISIIDR